MQRIAGYFELPTPDEGFDEIIFVGDKRDIDYGNGIVPDSEIQE
jgi:hypothetical protein